MVGSQLLTVNRVLKGLAAYSNNTCECGVSDRARSTGLDKSQTKRMLATLAARSFLEAHPVTGRCRLGPRLAALGCLAQQASDARPLLSASARRCRESAVFCQPHGEFCICAFAVDGPGPLRYAMSVGERYPGYGGGAAGDATFVHLFGSHVRALFGEHLPHTEGTPDEAHESVIKRYEKIRELGVAVAYGEHDPRSDSSRIPCAGSGGRSRLGHRLWPTRRDVSDHLLSDRGRQGRSFSTQRSLRTSTPERR